MLGLAPRRLALAVPAFLLALAAPAGAITKTYSTTGEATFTVPPASAPSP